MNGKTQNKGVFEGNTKGVELVPKMTVPGLKCKGLNNIHIVTEEGKAKLVTIDRFELHGVTRAVVNYGVDAPPVVTLSFYAKTVEIDDL